MSVSQCAVSQAVLRIDFDDFHSSCSLENSKLCSVLMLDNVYEKNGSKLSTGSVPGSQSFTPMQDLTLLLLTLCRLRESYQNSASSILYTS